MTNNDPLDPTDNNGTRKAPLGDPSAPPNPSVREAATSQTRSSATHTDASGAARSTDARGPAGKIPPGTTGMAASPSTSGADASSEGATRQQRQVLREDVRQTGERLKQEARDIADEARSRAEQHTGSRTSKERFPEDAGAAFHQISHFVREHPLAVLGGAALAGFLLTRALRRSAGQGSNRHYRAPGFSRDPYSSMPRPTTRTERTGLHPDDIPVY